MNDLDLMVMTPNLDLHHGNQEFTVRALECYLCVAIIDGMTEEVVFMRT